MTSRNWFEVGVRLIGLWEIVAGLDDLVAFVNMVMGLYRSTLTTPNAFLTHTLAHILIGFFLLFTAPSLVNAVYPPPQAAKEEPPATT